MATVTVSPRFQVVIPKQTRDKMEIKVGQQFQLIQYGDSIEFIPVRKIKEMKGFLKGIDTGVQRESNRI
ncbi:AbrB/MazE/SpoVT family DNA-binding domain-containing protein [candidate division KSB1 bacterium]|nr:AbrB/MazE/SpoVT family DNA-binding domain-containing protein [candidate division KSB1 bacterium]NIR70576.1 AbrB/MazE/SpoVT family DNA-binding domain-containing protein [candidate division KSB1 bacterium]NIS27712.1 AbrB/MazE/SpoVT family DNA-binding domain-containing protein [candidate division KSB1 bacterium]NIT74540.1 AbrB/MazE/SpoVT family DNA-binding domain-containing protein [candidate division KSB1 bacterium]NIU28365.1 AbrB/MazE/SpoVT family DNA-binding domain-containing protein [candid